MTTKGTGTCEGADKYFLGYAFFFLLLLAVIRLAEAFVTRIMSFFFFLKRSAGLFQLVLVSWALELLLV